MTAKTVTFANFKGGTGKTTNASLLSYHLAAKDYKTLLVDLDPQGNATSLMLKTYEVENNRQLDFNQTIMGGILEKDLSKVALTIKTNLDLLPAYKDFARYSDHLEDILPTKHRSERPKYFATLLEQIKENYDYILLDVPPTISVITDSALVASDYAVIIMQTQERSLSGGRLFVEEMIEIANEYNSNLDLLGVLPVILKSRALVDIATIEKATEIFGEINMFKTIVPYMERLKRWDVTGITNSKSDVHDKRVHALYEALTIEFLERIED